MPEHPESYNYTGAIRARLGWFGRLVLQVEVRAPQPVLYLRLAKGDDRKRNTVWRDATVRDLQIMRLPNNIERPPSPMSGESTFPMPLKK